MTILETQPSPVLLKRHEPGGALRRLREQAGLTIERAANLGETSPVYLEAVETGVLLPSREYSARVAQAFAAHLALAA